LNDEAQKLMEELGFSREGCSIYFSLLEKPSGETIEQVLAHSSFSSRDAERAVKELVEKGIVRVSSNKLEASERRCPGTLTPSMLRVHDCCPC